MIRIVKKYSARKTGFCRSYSSAPDPITIAGKLPTPDSTSSSAQTSKGPEVLTFSDAATIDKLSPAHINRFYTMPELFFSSAARYLTESKIMRNVLLTEERLILAAKVCACQAKFNTTQLRLASMPGSGKSCTLWWLANEFRRLNWLVLYEPFCVEFLDDPSEASANHLETQQEMFNSFKDSSGSKNPYKNTRLGRFWRGYNDRKKKKSPSFWMKSYLKALSSTPEIPCLIVLDQYNALIHKDVKLPTQEDDYLLVSKLRNFESVYPATGATLYGLSTYERNRYDILWKRDMRSLEFDLPPLDLQQTNLFLQLINSMDEMKEKQLNVSSIKSDVHTETMGLTRPLVEATQRLLYSREKRIFNNTSDEYLFYINKIMNSQARERVNTVMGRLTESEKEYDRAITEIYMLTKHSWKAQQCKELAKTGLLEGIREFPPPSFRQAISYIIPNDFALSFNKVCDYLDEGGQLELRIVESVSEINRLVLPTNKDPKNAKAKKYTVKAVERLRQNIPDKEWKAGKLEKFTFYKMTPGQQSVDAIFVGDEEVFFISMSINSYPTWLASKKNKVTFADDVCKTNIYGWVRANVEGGENFPSEPAEEQRRKFSDKFLEKVHFLHLSDTNEKHELTNNEDCTIAIEGEDHLHAAGFLAERLMRRNFKKETAK